MSQHVRRSGQFSVLLVAACAAALAACQVASPVAKTGAQTAATGNKADQPNVTYVNSPENGIGLPPPASVMTDGTPVLPASTPELSTSTRAQALASANTMAIKAADGGTYTSPDGSLTVTIPPGALSQDTTVRFSRVDTSKVATNGEFTPGIVFVADLGGATVGDNETLMVTSKVDPRLIDDARQHVANFTPDMMGLSQGPDGTWKMTMPLRGDITNGAAQPTPVQGSNWELREFGPSVGTRQTPAFTLAAPAAAAPNLYSIFDVAATAASGAPAPAPTATPTPAPTPTPIPRLTPIAAGYDTIDNLPAMPVSEQANYPLIPSMLWWSGQDYALVKTPFDPSPHADVKIYNVVRDTMANYGEFFTCLSIWHHDCGTASVNDAIAAVETYNQAVAHHRQPTDAMRTLAFSYYKVDGQRITNCSYTDARPMIVNMSFDSDDPSAAGPITNGSVTFGTGAASITRNTDQNGSASQSFQPTTVSISATWPNPNGLSAAPIANPAVTSATMVVNQPSSFHVNLTWHKYSPAITLKLTGDAPITDPVVVFNVDGQERTFTKADFSSFTGSGTTKATVTFYARVGDDTANHTFKLVHLTATNGGMSTPDGYLPGAASVQRTKSFSYDLRMYNIAQK